MRDVMMFPPTEREATLQEVRVELAKVMKKLCAETLKASECFGAREGDCVGCPIHSIPHINGVLDKLARKKGSRDGG